MPELPEVETTRRGVEPYVTGRTILALQIHEVRLRWPVDADIPARVQGALILGAARRAKYLIFILNNGGNLLLHLGMSGSLRVLPASTPRLKHDHLDLQLDSGKTLRFNDPRRFGSLHYIQGNPETHPLLCKLAPEPFDKQFNSDYLWKLTRKRRVAIKQLIMNAHCVVGVGNIYASEALFRAGVCPKRMARSLKRVEIARLVAKISEVLTQAIKVGGTTLRDYVSADGKPGYFRQKLFVYERAGKSCRICQATIRQTIQGNRSTYWCPTCQH